MLSQRFKSDQIRYQSADTGHHIYRQIRENAAHYFSKNGNNRFANLFFWIKLAIIAFAGFAGFAIILYATTFGWLVTGYFIFGFAMLLLSMNTGHDAAHHTQ